MIYCLGPCSAETREQVQNVARAISHAKTQGREEAKLVFRAGVWKPRTSPDSFEGVGEKALLWLKEVQDELGIDCATEVATPEQARMALEAGIHYLWLGARTTTNPILVQEIAERVREFKSLKGMLVKNPINPDLGLWIGAIERIKRALPEIEIIAVHRGFSTEESAPYRNTPLWTIPIELKRHYPNLPLLCDASHIAGKRELIPALLQTAADLNYDGVMLETHPQPAEALSDKEQQLTPAELIDTLQNIRWHKANQPQELLVLRHEIDDLDDQLWQLILKRLRLAKEIGLVKREENLPVLQTDRYKEIIDKRLTWAKEHGINPQTVEDITQALHAEAIQHQLQQERLLQSL